jgi:hypothetical protein
MVNVVWVLAVALHLYTKVTCTSGRLSVYVCLPVAPLADKAPIGTDYQPGHKDDGGFTMKGPNRPSHEFT